MGDVIKDFIKYWDKWHEEWWSIASGKSRSPEYLKDKWKLPQKKIQFKSSKKTYGKKGNQVKTKTMKVFKAFPEPYWISEDILNGEKPKAVFININPAGPRFYHLNHVKEKLPNDDEKNNHDKKWTDPNSYFDWIQNYIDKNLSYSDSINKLIEIYSEEEKFWHVEKRVKWLNDYFEPKISLKDIASFELCPWHTIKAEQIDSDWLDADKTVEYIIKPAMTLANMIDEKSILSKKIVGFGKVTEWNNHLCKLKPDWQHLIDMNNEHGRKIVVHNGLKSASMIDVWFNNKEQIFFLIFQGSQNMKLPALEKSVCFLQIEEDKYLSVYLKDFLKDINDYLIPLG